MKIFVLDIETLVLPEDVDGGWDNPYGMGFGTAVIYDYDQDQYKLLGPRQTEECITLLEGGLVISFNGIKFDNSVILGNNYKSKWKDCDLLNEIIKSKYQSKSIKDAQKKFGNMIFKNLGLGVVSEATLCMSKTGTGAHAPLLIKEGRWEQVYSYNLHDVRLTRKLYEFIQKNKFVIDGSGQKIEVNNKDLFG